MTIDKYSVFGRPMSKPQKPTTQQQRIITHACEPLINELKTKITPLPNPQIGNHLIDIYGKWFRNQYHIYLTYQCPPNSLENSFDLGLIRLGWTGRDTYLIYFYMAHRNKWEAFYEDIPLEKAIVRIKESDFF